MTTDSSSLDQIMAELEAVCREFHATPAKPLVFELHIRANPRLSPQSRTEAAALLRRAADQIEAQVSHATGGAVLEDNGWQVGGWQLRPTTDDEYLANPTNADWTPAWAAE